jgi:hypothetical protein
MMNIVAYLNFVPASTYRLKETTLSVMTVVNMTQGDNI